MSSAKFAESGLGPVPAAAGFGPSFAEELEELASEIEQPGAGQTAGGGDAEESESS